MFLRTAQSYSVVNDGLYATIWNNSLIIVHSGLIQCTANTTAYGRKYRCTYNDTNKDYYNDIHL
jgi:hypothetical protein